MKDFFDLIKTFVTDKRRKMEQYRKSTEDLSTVPEPSPGAEVA